MACECGRFEVERQAADGYVVRAPVGAMGRALERACSSAVPLQSEGGQ
jgi:hypothetical protein